MSENATTTTLEVNVLVSVINPNMVYLLPQPLHQNATLHFEGLSPNSRLLVNMFLSGSTTIYNKPVSDGPNQFTKSRLLDPDTRKVSFNFADGEPFSPFHVMLLKAD